MYVIYYSGIFNEGYVKHVSIWGRPKRGFVPHETHQEALDFATKFRFKIVANIFCWAYNSISRRNYEFRNFEVRKITQKVKAKKPVFNPSNN